MTRNRLKFALIYRSLFLFDSQNLLRRATSWLVINSYFESFIMVSIIISSCLAGASRTEEIKVIDLALNCIFIFELVAKIISYGFLLHPHAYIRDPFNVLDATIILMGFSASVKSITGESGDVDFTILRLVRVFRPLRLLVVAKELRIVLQTIIQCSKALLHVAVFIVFLLMLFAIVGLELFNGKLHHACYEIEAQTLSNPLRVCSAENDTLCGTGGQCIGNWSGPNYGISSFDNIGYSLFVVLQIITLEDWVFIYYQLIDAVGSKWHSIYFVSLIFLGSYFSLDLLLGVLTNQYMKTKDVVARQQNTNHKVIVWICQKSQSFLQYWKRIPFTRKSIKCDTRNIQNEVDDNISDGTFENSVRTKSHPLDTEVSNGVLQKSKAEAKHLKIGKFIFKLTHSKFYFWYGLIAIATNTAFQVASHNKNTSETEDCLDIINTLFNVLFAIELILNIKGFGTKRMIQEKFRMFDAMTILISFFDVVYSKLRGRRNSGISIIRSLTLIRAFQITKFWPSLLTMYYSFIKSIKTIFSLLVVLLLILFIYALLGNHLFKHLTQSADAETSIGSFETIGKSMLLVFVLLTGEGWPAFTANIIFKYEKKNAVKKIVPLLYFLSFIILGNFILLNIFLGIIIDHLTTQPEDSKTIDINNVKRQKSIDSSAKRNQQLSKPCNGVDGTLTKNDFAETKGTKTETEKYFDNRSNSNMAGFPPDNEAEGKELLNMIQQRLSLFRIEENYYTTSIETWKQENMTRPLSPLPNETPIPQHTSLFLFSPSNKLRVILYKVATSIWFPNLCLGSIIISTLLLAFEDPLNRDKNFSKGLRYCDHIFTGVFTLEIIVKIIAFGLLLGHPSCYLRNKLNVIDTVVVILSLTNIILNAVSIDPPLHLRVLRILRVFRGLKMSKNLQYVINCLVSTLAKIFNYFLLYIFLLFIYAVIGVKLYAGKLKKNPNHIQITFDNDGNQNGTKIKGLLEDADYNFNNVLNAMVTLFSIGTLDNWIVDLQQIISQASDISRSTSILFVVSFLLVMTFIMLNVFVGFVVMAFQIEKEQQDGFEILDKRGQECIALAFRLNPETSYMDRKKLQQTVWKYLNSPSFEYCTFFCVILNCVIMMTKHYNQDKLTGTVQEVANFFFTTLFSVELLLKLFALSPAAYAKDNWCVLDTIVVLGSWVDIILLSFKINIYVNLSMFRIFRVIRLCRIINKRDSLRQIMATFFRSIRCVPSISMLILMVLFMYAVLGMQLFGKIGLTESGPINRHVNFQNFPTALMVLLRITTMDNWRELMIACADTYSNNCVNDPANNCGSKLSYPFFLSFVFLSAFVITNLFLAVIMDNFMYLTLDPSMLSCYHINMFANIWKEFDPNNSGRIHTSLLVPLLKRLSPPIGFGEMCPKRIIYAKMQLMNLIIDDKSTVGFRELLLTLVVRCLSSANKTDKIRKEIAAINKHVSPCLLDNIMPVFARSINSSEKSFKIYCASSTIKLYFRMIQSVLKKKKQQVSCSAGETKIGNSKTPHRIISEDTTHRKSLHHSKKIGSLSDTCMLFGKPNASSEKRERNRTKKEMTRNYYTNRSVSCSEMSTLSIWINMKPLTDLTTSSITSSVINKPLSNNESCFDNTVFKAIETDIEEPDKHIFLAPENTRI